MPFTVSCAACDSRFLLGDDLFRRKVSGKVVTVKCRTCNAEISVDATEPTTLPSRELPPQRARPAPPRPKHKEGDAATGTPLPTGAATATGTPLPAGRTAATVTPLPAGALLSIWDAAEKSVEAPRKGPLPRPHPPMRTASLAPELELELIDEVEEIPPSSSDGPSLNALTHESAPPKQQTPKKPPDDFLVNLSAGTGGILGAPTIDVSGLGTPPRAEAEELLEVEATELTPRAGTIPLFDMSAVLPVASESRASNGSPSHLDLSIDVEVPQTPSKSGKPRERKYVVAPKTPEATPAPKSRRAGAALWFALVAAAPGVVLVVALRGHATSHPVTPEAQASERAAPSVVEHAVPANIEVTPAPAAVGTTAANAGMTTAGQAESTSNAAPTTPGVKGVNATKPPAAEPAVAETPRADITPPLEKPVEVDKPTLPPPRPMPEPAEPGTEFDRAAAIAALKAAAAEAASCRKDGDPSGTASLTITFAPSGRVTSANIQGPPFAGTPTGGCIANAMRHAHVPAFSGDRVTVSKTIVIQ